MFFLLLFSIKRKKDILEILTKENIQAKVRYVKFKTMLIRNKFNYIINQIYHLEIRKKKCLNSCILCIVVVMKQNHLVHHRAHAHRAVAPSQ